VADAGPDIPWVDFAGDGVDPVQLDGSRSWDSDGEIVSYDWYEYGAWIANGIYAAPWLSVGYHEITLVVTDNRGDTSSDVVIVKMESPPYEPGALHITTVNENGEPLVGACYFLYMDLGGYYDTEYAAGFACDADDGAADGVIDMYDVPPDTYFVVQSSSADGYSNGADHHVTIVADTAEYITVQNLPS
jgi:hypothetical protein